MADSKILVFDLECTCWMGHPPEGMRQEIIEIGCCLLDVNTWAISQRRSIIVRPSSSTISEFCTRFTSLTQEVVDKGVSLRDACDILVEEYGSTSAMSSAWGRFDAKQLNKDCRHSNLPSPLSGRHINAQRRFAAHSGIKQEMSVTNALNHINKQFDGMKHRAVDDAYNTAVLLSHIMSTEPVSINGHH